MIANAAAAVALVPRRIPGGLLRRSWTAAGRNLSGRWIGGRRVVDRFAAAAAVSEIVGCLAAGTVESAIGKASGRFVR